MKRTKSRPTSTSSLRAFAVGLIINAAAFLGCVFIGALIIGTTENPLAHSGLGAAVAFYVGGGISGFCCAKYKKEGAILHTSLSSLVFCLILLVICLIISGGALPALLLLNYAVYILISALASLIGSRERGRRRR